MLDAFIDGLQDRKQMERSNLMNKHGSSIRRFPRRVTGIQAAALATLSWQEPEFSVSIPKNKRAFVVFKFKVPVSAEVRQICPALCDMLVASRTRADDWERFLTEAYRKAKSGKRDVHQCISGLLRRVYQALGLYLREVWDGCEDLRDAKDKQLTAFHKRSGIKRSQPDPAVALRIAMKFEDYKAKVRELLANIDKQRTASDPVISEMIRNHLPGVDIRKVLSPITKGDKLEEWWKLNARSSPNQIAAALVKAEIGAKEFAPAKGKNSLETYIRLGQQIRKAVMKLPLPIG